MSILQQVTLAVFLLLVCTGASISSAQSTPPAPPDCFAIRVELNGKSVESPTRIIVKTKTSENTILISNGCFEIPEGIFQQKAADVLFTVPGSSIHISEIPTGFFVGPWDVELEDGRFKRGTVVPKSARPREMCAVVFHVGDPETVLTQTGCRSATKAGS